MPGCLSHLPDGLAGCDGCRAVWRQYDRRRRARIADGTWLPKADPAQVCRHVAALRSAGLTVREIATAAGIDRVTLQRLPSRRWMTGATAAAILAVEPPELEDSPAADVDEVAVERALKGERLPLNDDEVIAAVRAGTARGLSHQALADLLGIDFRAVRTLAGGSVPPRFGALVRRRLADVQSANRSIDSQATRAA